MNRTPSSSKPTSAFTLIELLVVIVIIAILAALIFPAVQSVRRKATQTKCAQNLKTWGIAIRRYAQEHNGEVHWRNWASIGSSQRYYNPYFGTEAITKGPKEEMFTQEYFRWCPAQSWGGGGNAPVGYSFIRPSDHSTYSSRYWPVPDPYNLRKAQKPSKLLLMIDGNTLNIRGADDLDKAVRPICVSGSGQDVRHGGSVNALFADGHVTGYRWKDIDGDTPEEKAKVEQWFHLD